MGISLEVSEETVSYEDAYIEEEHKAGILTNLDGLVVLLDTFNDASIRGIFLKIEPKCGNALKRIAFMGK